jgi:hypothetical protein
MASSHLVQEEDSMHPAIWDGEDLMVAYYDPIRLLKGTFHSPYVAWFIDA